MGNPLDLGVGSPPAPIPDPDRRPFNALTSGNALMPQQQQRQMPAPGHQQTVAALRHFMAIVDELLVLEKNPSLGKSNIKDAIIDGVGGLVASRMLSAAAAVPILANVPEDPLAQRKWMQGMLKQTIQAQNNVLDHHVAGSPATLDWAHESQHQAGSPDDHMQTMDGLASTYRS